MAGWKDFIRSELIDIVEWPDDSGDALVHRFERHDNEIKNGAQLADKATAGEIVPSTLVWTQGMNAWPTACLQERRSRSPSFAPMAMPDSLSLFAVTAPGLERVCTAELAALGIAGAAEPGGVAWEGDAPQLYAANLGLRTASRVLVRVGEFRARTFFELERHARRLPWENFIAAGATVEPRVTCRKSKLYHEGAVAERMVRAMEHCVGPVRAARGREAEPDAEDEGAAAQLFVVRFVRDRCTVSADASGALLHRRGYRQAVARAPLRENLAAAMLLASGWTGDAPLLDPLCGAGTLVIEAALLAGRIPPGLADASRTPRDFAFRQWPTFNGEAWERAVARAAAEIRPAAGIPLAGSDRDAGAVQAARANAERAGVAADVVFTERALSAAEPPAAAGQAGWLITNPPYGVRVGETDALRNLYAALGRTAREHFAGWTLALLSAEPRLEAQVRIPLTEVFQTRNGGIPVRLVAGRVPR